MFAVNNSYQHLIQFIGRQLYIYLYCYNGLSGVVVYRQQFQIIAKFLSGFHWWETVAKFLIQLVWLKKLKLTFSFVEIK